MGHGRVESEGEFILGRIIFGGDQIQRQANVLRLVPDRIGETAGVGEVSGAVDHAARGIVGHDLVIIGANEGVGFEFYSDFGAEAKGGPCGHGAFQFGAGQMGIKAPSEA